MLAAWRGRFASSPRWRMAAAAVALLLVFGIGREVGKRQGEAALSVEQNEIIFDSLHTWYELEIGQHVHSHTCLASDVDGRGFCILEKAQPLFTSVEEE